MLDTNAESVSEVMRFALHYYHFVISMCAVE